MTRPTLAEANQIVAAAFETGAELNLKPLSVVVLDAGGHLVAFQRQDGASMSRFEIAFGKAYGALAIGVGSRSIGNMAIERPHFFTGLSNALNGRVIPVAGGVLVRRDGETIGAVGVTGDTSDNDERCAVTGIEGIGLDSEC